MDVLGIENNDGLKKRKRQMEVQGGYSCNEKSYRHESLK